MRALGVAALALLGLGAGACWSLVSDPRSGTGTERAATPMEAASPSVPGVATWTPFSDPDLPSLPLEVALAEQQIGGGKTAVSVAVPTAWLRRDRFANEAMWHPHGYPRFTYFLRIEVVSSQHASTDRLREAYVARLPDDFSRPRVHETGDDRLWFSRENDGHLQHSLIRWVDLPPEDGEANVEVAVIGRERDLPGMRRLLEAVSTSAAYG